MMWIKTANALHEEALRHTARAGLSRSADENMAHYTISVILDSLSRALLLAIPEKDRVMEEEPRR